MRFKKTLSVAVNAITRAADPTGAGCTKVGRSKASMKISGSTKPSGTWPKSSAPKESDWLQAPGSATRVRRFLTTVTIKAIALKKHGAGRRCYPCQVLAETPNKFRVKILAAEGVTL